MRIPASAEFAGAEGRVLKSEAEEIKELRSELVLLADDNRRALRRIALGNKRLAAMADERAMLEDEVQSLRNRVLEAVAASVRMKAEIARLRDRNGLVERIRRDENDMSEAARSERITKRDVGCANGLANVRLRITALETKLELAEARAASAENAVRELRNVIKQTVADARRT
jgi:hypothetical protein